MQLKPYGSGGWCPFNNGISLPFGSCLNLKAMLLHWLHGDSN